MSCSYSTVPKAGCRESWQVKNSLLQDSLLSAEYILLIADIYYGKKVLLSLMGMCRTFLKATHAKNGGVGLLEGEKGGLKNMAWLALNHVNGQMGCVETRFPSTNNFWICNAAHGMDSLMIQRPCLFIR